MDFKNLNSEQDKIVQEIWAVCNYFYQMRLTDISDDVLAKFAREIALKMISLERVSK